MLDDEGLASNEVKATSVNVELWGGRGLVWVRDAGEVLDDTFTSLLVKSLGVSLLADFK